MSTYPGAVDSFPDRADGDPIPSTDHDNLASAVVAVETELGTNPSGSAATVAERLTTIEGSLGGGGAVSSVVGQTGAVTGAQILADATVAAALTGKLATTAGAVGTANLAAGAVTAAKVAADVATQAELDAAISALSGTYAPLVHGHVQSDVTGLAAALAAKAPLADPAFTGNPTAPTPSPGDNDTSVATTAFVTAAVSTSVASLNVFNAANFR